MRLSWLLLLCAGCFLKGQQVDALYPMCVRYVDDFGYLRGREASFNRSGRRDVLRRYEFSTDGACPAGAQGPPQRVDVCLVKSRRCNHDRTTNLWEDQVEQYFERYPGSYRGRCTSECSKHKDDCVREVYISDWQGWMRDMEEIIRSRRPGAPPP